MEEGILKISEGLPMVVMTVQSFLVLEAVGFARAALS